MLGFKAWVKETEAMYRTTLLNRLMAVRFLALQDSFHRNILHWKNESTLWAFVVWGTNSVINKLTKTNKKSEEEIAIMLAG